MSTKNVLAPFWFFIVRNSTDGLVETHSALSDLDWGNNLEHSDFEVMIEINKYLD